MNAMYEDWTLIVTIMDTADPGPLVSSNQRKPTPAFITYPNQLHHSSPTHPNPSTNDPSMSQHNKSRALLTENSSLQVWPAFRIAHRLHHILQPNDWLNYCRGRASRQSDRDRRCRGESEVTSSMEETRGLCTLEEAQQKQNAILPAIAGKAAKISDTDCTPHDRCSVTASDPIDAGLADVSVISGQKLLSRMDFGSALVRTAKERRALAILTDST